MKIAFFIGDMQRGGAERVISILANHYAELGWDVDILLLLGKNVDYILNPKIVIIPMDFGKGSYIRRLPGWLKMIRCYVRKNNPDRIISFVGRINMLVLTATLGIKIPIIVSERNDPKHDGRGKLILMYCNWIYHRAKAIVYQTEYEQSCFSNKLCKGCIIPNPVEVAAEGIECNRLEIVTAGRLMPQKNQAMLIEAVAKIKDKFPEVKLKIYGSGVLKEKLQEQINKQGLSEKAELCGNVVDLHSKLAGAAVFVLTSEFEGLSNALIEAMMLGIPCISTDYPGADEVIEDGYNGMLIPCRDIYALAGALERILSDHDFACKLRENEMQSSERYKKSIVLKQWESVIESNG